MSPRTVASPIFLSGDAAEELPRGRVFLWISPQVPELQTFVYLPRSVSVPRRAMVSIHGITRNAMDHALLFSKHAEAAGVAVVAPLFSEPRFRGYQTLRKRRQRLAPEQAFERVLDDLAAQTGLQLERLPLFGFSGGGQFAHRFAMFRPERVERLVVGAAGWYTFPDMDAPYPRGLAALPERLDASKLAEFLRLPTLVIVGDADLQRDDALNKHPDIDQQQGLTRVDRAQAWVAAMQSGASRRGHIAPVRFQLLHGAEHSFSDAIKRRGLGPIALDFLFGDLGRAADLRVAGPESGP